MDPRTEMVRYLCQTRLESFTQMAFDWVYSDRQFKHHWPMEVIGDYLTRCHEGKIKRLIINLPPRYLKSFCASVAFPAWVLAHKPEAKIMCVAGSRGLAEDHHTLTQRLMTHPGYRAVFPHVRISESSKTIRLVHGGLRSAHVASPGGGITGRGADIVIIDDPLGASYADDNDRRERINAWYDQNIFQRLNNKTSGVVIVVMQRLHIDDLTGHLLKQDGWEHLNLSAIAVEDEVYTLRDGRKVGSRQGEALHPGLEDCEQIKKIMLAIGAIPFMAQYQQDPYPPGKGLGHHGALTVLPNDPSIPLGLCGPVFGHLREEDILLERIFGIRLGIQAGPPPPMTTEEWMSYYGGPREIPELPIVTD